MKVKEVSGSKFLCHRYVSEIDPGTVECWEASNKEPLQRSQAKPQPTPYYDSCGFTGQHCRYQEAGEAMGGH